MIPEHIRVRFAPSPTGFMHIGNVSSALLNYLFAQQKKGTFILRIEDTDTQRNCDPSGKQIIEDLMWLKLTYDEGPQIGGPHEPYLQSQRTEIYKSSLHKLDEKKAIYRCFCTIEELEKKRLRQIALKMPPRYDRTCLYLTPAEVEYNLSKSLPFIWRFKLNDEIIVIQDLARGSVTYDLKNFADFPLTRQDGSFTFIFANFVDDLTMHITHIFRGEDHLSNTALQAALYKEFNAKIPIFWHLPLICNKEGKKLSKRDFGFSLNDLRNAGFLPEAINNYLATLGGATFEKEIMDLAELVHDFNFEKISASGHIKYDIDRLRWINHKWISRLDIYDLMERCIPFLKSLYPQINSFSKPHLAHLLQVLRTDFVTLADSATSLSFYFTMPALDKEVLNTYHFENHRNILKAIYQIMLLEQNNSEEWVSLVSAYCKTRKISLKEIFTLLRIGLTGSPQGPGIKELFEILQPQETLKRFNALINFS